MVLAHCFLCPVLRMRLEASNSKTRSITSWPIFAYGFSTSATETFGSAAACSLEANAMFSRFARFHSLIMVGDIVRLSQVGRRQFLAVGLMGHLRL